MKKSNRANVLLMELMAAVLLFALSATVMIRIYAQAYEKSARAGVMDDALCEAQNLAERLYAAGGTEGMQALLSGEGFAQEDGLWRLCSRRKRREPACCRKPRCAPKAAARRSLRCPWRVI